MSTATRVVNVTTNVGLRVATSVRDILRMTLPVFGLVSALWMVFVQMVLFADLMSEYPEIMNTTTDFGLIGTYTFGEVVSGIYSGITYVIMAAGVYLFLNWLVAEYEPTTTKEDDN